VFGGGGWGLGMQVRSICIHILPDILLMRLHDVWGAGLLGARCSRDTECLLLL
jgi:hypothetical protein